ncbi:hypothetical protein K1719_011457 [Acacia pycnantha]|nr:hypothetical protein K1719_011457 [Acacia pycnantha]
MYNQVNHGPHTPIQPTYQQRHQAPPPPFHFQQGSPAPPGQHVPNAVPPHIGVSAPHIYMHGPPASSSIAPLNSSVQGSSSLVQNTGQSFAVPRPLLHGNSLMPQTFSSFGQNSQHSSNMGVHAHHIPPSVHPPLSNPRHETSWTPGPSPRVLPPPPPPPPSSQSQGQPMYQIPFPPRPPPPGDVQSLQHIPPLPPAPSTSGFHASTPDESADSSRHHDHLNVVTEDNSAADSDMEMEDDITLSEKDQGLNNTTEVLNRQHEVIEIGSKNQTHQLQNSLETDPPNDILASDITCSGPLGGSNACEVPEHLFESEKRSTAKTVTKVLSTMDDSVEVLQFPEGKAVAPQAADFIDCGASDPVANPDRDSGQRMRSGSPMRLLQNYASDDSADNEHEACFADARTLSVSTAAATSASVAHKDLDSFLETDIGSKISSATQEGRELLSNTSASVNFAASVEPSKGKDVLSSAGIDSSSKSGNAEQGNKKTSKFELNPLKVDKFGRVAREDPTDSDSDDSRNHRTRRRNKRDRSWSRSLSPLERSGRRRKRSPWRRKDKRSRSRSWSPRNRRSRSRSPILRRSGEFNSENKKRDKGKCFDFLRGKCYRGASCRYLHHEPEKNTSSRRYRNKRDLEVSSKSSRIHEVKKNISAKVSGDECERVRSQDVLLSQKVSGSSTGQEVEQRKEEDYVKNAFVSTLSDHDSQPFNAAPTICENAREVAPEVRETLAAAEETKTIIHDNEPSSSQQPLAGGFPSNSISGGDALKPSDGASQDVFPSEQGSSVQLLRSNVSVGMLEHSYHPSQIINNSVESNLLPDGNRLTACFSEISTSKPLPCMLPSTQLQSTSSSTSKHLSSEQFPLSSVASKELPAHSSVGFPLHSYQLPLPPALPHSYCGNSGQPQMSRDYVSMQQNTPFPYQSTSREPYPGIFHAPNPHFFVPPINSWMSLPPPPPPPQFAYSSNLTSGAPTSYVSSESNENKLHLRTDFVSQTSVRIGQPSHIQSAESQDQAYPGMQEHSRPLTHMETFSSKLLSQGNLVSQSHLDFNVGKEDHYEQLPIHDSKSLSSPSFARLQSQPKPFSWESDVNRLHSSSSKLPPEEHFKAASFIHPLSQKQQTVHGSYSSASDGNLGVHGETVTASIYPPDVLDGNHSASLPDFGGSRIAAHYNPYASTFEQPLSSKFSSSIFRQEKDMIHVDNYGSSSSLHRTSVNEQGVFGVGSRQTTSPESARANRQMPPRSGGDQYDPLFDSIEPSSTSLKKSHLDQKQEVTGESNVSLRPKSSLKSLDVEENKQWEIDATASTSSQNNDEYGETADAEVGAVENESLSNPVDGAKMATGEIEIDQVKSPGKRKKSKDSRSMKLFKVSIANFVKEVLKPSWRQGNMSKVAFKTIVKKTVDKVSGAMKGHRVPKSQEKINQYIDSSQRKLTKLVMGYVDKYVKV